MRFRRLQITPESLMAMFTDGAETHLRVISNGLPEGTTFVRITGSDQFAGIDLIVEHPSFDELKSGDLLPIHPPTVFEDIRTTCDITDQFEAIRHACAEAGFTDAESQADPAKVIRTLAAVLGEREKELLALREKAQWSIY